MKQRRYIKWKKQQQLFIISRKRKKKIIIIKFNCIHVTLERWFLSPIMKHFFPFRNKKKKMEALSTPFYGVSVVEFGIDVFLMVFHPSEKRTQRNLFFISASSAMLISKMPFLCFSSFFVYSFMSNAEKIQCKIHLDLNAIQ